MRQRVTFVVAPRHRAEDLEIRVVNDTDEDLCVACGRPLDPGEEARKRGREFMVMILARARGQFWDGMREVIQERGYMT